MLIMGICVETHGGIGGPDGEESCREGGTFGIVGGRKEG